MYRSADEKSIALRERKWLRDKRLDGAPRFAQDCLPLAGKFVIIRARPLRAEFGAGAQLRAGFRLPCWADLHSGGQV